MSLSLKQSITNNASDLSVLQSSFDALTIDVSEAVAFHYNIISEDANVKVLSDRVTSNASNISILDTASTNQATEIDVLEESIATKATSIQNLNTGFTSEITRVEGLIRTGYLYRSSWAF